MKLPDLHDVEAARVIEFHGTADAVSHAAHEAKLKYLSVDLANADSKSALMDALARGFGFPAHFGHNWDALADCLEDDHFLAKPGAVARLTHTGPFHRAHPADWTTLEEILGEAVEYWKERHIAFWVVMA